MSADLDAEVAREIMHAPHIDGHHKVSELPKGIVILPIGDQSFVIKVPSDPFTYTRWHPSSNIADAFEVVAEMQRRGWVYDLWFDPELKLHACSFTRPDHQGLLKAYKANTPTEAICHAALAVVRKEQAS